jgi:phosphoglycolate phosphatase-like HAD superfamily hydrolase
MQQEGILFRLVSNRDADSTRIIMGRQGMGIWTEPHHFVDIGPTAKESPQAAEILRRIVVREGADRSRVVFVGDSAVDMVAGANIDAFCVGLLGGMSPQPDLEAAGADTYAECLSDALEQITERFRL